MQTDLRCLRDHDHYTGKFRGAAHNIVYFTLRFIDSIKFFSASLDNLVENSKLGSKDPAQNFPILKKHFPKNYPLLLRKGVYPYEYFTDYTKMLETKLPPKEAFYSQLKISGISDEEYKHAVNVYETFGCKNLGEYTELYCLSDVLQLADIWQVFTKETIETYELDPGHYIALPSLSWDAMLKFTGVEKELISDPTMHQCIEKSIRGGISMIVERFSRANNKYLPETYDPSKPSRYIMYFDKNNLYGYGMSQPLPIGGFRFAAEREISEIDMMNLPKCFIEVDLEYPKSLHDLHNDFPCAPEHVGEGDERRLICGLNDKYNYWLHYRLLETYLRLGLKVRKIHNVIFFKEKSFMKNYIKKDKSLLAR